MGHFTVPYEAEGAGSGVIFYSDDDKIAIATNNHVIEGANSIYVTLDGDKSVPGIDTDDLTLAVYQCAAAVAAVDCRAGLQNGQGIAVYVNGLLLHADNAVRCGKPHTHGVADSNDTFADLKVIRIAEGCGCYLFP